MSFHRGPYGGGGGMTFAAPPLTPMIKRILITLVIAFVVQMFIELVAGGWELLRGWVALVPAVAILRLRVWELATYALLHGGLFHLLFNLLGLWMFGGDVERVLGSRGVLRYFLVCVIGGGLLHSVVALVIGGGAALVPVVGASAGILGLVLAFALFFPHRQVFIFPLPFPIKAWVMAVIFGAIDLYSAISATGAQLQGRAPAGGGVAFIAHLGGMLAGWLYLKGFIRPGGWGRGSWFRSRRKGFRVVDGDRRDRWDVH
jgi:membrane associated rhomboid family serine protease